MYSYMGIIEIRVLVFHYCTTHVKCKNLQYQVPCNRYSVNQHPGQLFWLLDDVLGILFSSDRVGDESDKTKHVQNTFLEKKNTNAQS